jgi:hypothetical protein
MTKTLKSAVIFLSLLLFTTACSTTSTSTAKIEQSTYEELLGNSVMDDAVVNFFAGNDCVSAMQFQLCRESGMAFWMDSEQVVNMVYLYSGHADGFNRYRGELPFGLTFYDPMWRVEEKLSAVDAEDTSQATHELGLPDEGGTPDHFHYWAVYERFGMVVIYDAPSADEDAYIYAIVIKN